MHVPTPWDVAPLPLPFAYPILRLPPSFDSSVGPCLWIAYYIAPVLVPYLLPRTFHGRWHWTCKQHGSFCALRNRGPATACFIFFPTENIPLPAFVAFLPTTTLPPLLVNSTFAFVSCVNKAVSCYMPTYTLCHPTYIPLPPPNTSPILVLPLFSLPYLSTLQVCGIFSEGACMCHSTVPPPASPCVVST